MTRSRRTFTAQEKAAAVKRYLVDKIPVSDLCDQLGLQPTQIYAWQKQLFENAEAAFVTPGRKSKQGDAKDKKIQSLEAKIQVKNEVRLHSAIGYVTPHTKLAGREEEVFTARDQKLEAAREQRRLRRQQLAA